MATNFYKQNGSYFTVGDNRKISNLEELQGLSKAGGKELQAIDGAKYNTGELQKASFDNIQPIGNTLYGLPRQQATLPVNQAPSLGMTTPKIDSDTLKIGSSVGDISNILPSDSYQSMINQRMLNSMQSSEKNLAQIQSEREKFSAQYSADVARFEQQKRDTQGELLDQSQGEIDSFRSQLQPVKDSSLEMSRN
jgi:hypothetical protein